MTLKGVVFLLTCFLLTVIPSIAQDDVIHVDTDLVAVPVSVLDRNGKYISTLKREDFKIFEDNVEQQIEHFETVEGSVTVLMLIERTGAIGAQLPRVVAAANTFVKHMRPEDTLIALTFGSSADVVIKETKVKDVPKGIRVGRYFNDRAGPQLYGAIGAAMKKLAKVQGRKAIIVFTEGYNSEMSYTGTSKGTLKAAEENDATIYTIKFGSPYEVPKAVQNMGIYKQRLKDSDEYMLGLATRTGGRAFKVEEIENLDATFAEVAGELVRQYVLGYTPLKSGTGSERRKIKVQVSTPGVVIRARKEVVYIPAKK